MTLELTDGMNDLIWGIDQDGYEIEEVPARKSTKTYSHIGRGLLDSHITPAHTDIRSLGGPIMEFRPNHKFPGLFFTFADTLSEPEALKEFISKHGLLTRYKLEREGIGSLKVRIDDLIKHQIAFRQVVKAYDEGDQDQADALYEEKLQPKLKTLMSRVNPTRPILRVAPVDLLGLMWLQLGQYIAGQADFARCENCGTPFRRARTSKKTCSGACRKAVSRKRLKEKQQ